MHTRASHSSSKGGHYTQDEIIRCAWLYYMQDHTQEEVARELGMSRARVVRLLKEAKSLGLVQIKINAPVERLALAEQVRNHYRRLNLRRVHLVPTIDDELEQKFALARELPTVFAPANDAIVAVSWGTTLSYAIDYLPENTASNNGHPGNSSLKKTDAPSPTVVSIFGGIQGGIHTANPYDIAFRLGQKLHAHVYTIQAPAFVRDPEVAHLLMRQESVQSTLAVGLKAQYALFGVGDVTEKSTVERINAITSDERKWLAAHDAVGDLLGHFLDIHGNIIDTEGRLTPISLPLTDLKTIPERICIGGGPVKHEMILAMLRGGYISTLITDEGTAEYLLSVKTPSGPLAKETPSAMTRGAKQRSEQAGHQEPLAREEIRK